MINIVLGMMVKVVLLVALGYYVKKIGMVTESFEKQLSALLVNIIFPINVIASSNNDFNTDRLRSLLLILGISVLYYTLAILFGTKAGKLLRLPVSERNIFMTMCAFGNTAFVGIPIVQELLGIEGMLYAVVYNMCYQFAFFSYGIAALSGNGQFKVKDMWNPCVQSSLLACLLFVLQVKFPAPIEDTIGAVGNMVVPLSMMIIGFGLTDIRFIEIFKDWRAYMVSAVRLLIFPGIMFAACNLCGVSKELTLVATIMTGVPSGSMNVIMARQYGCDMNFATKSVVQSMIFSIITIPLLIAMVY